MRKNIKIIIVFLVSILLVSCNSQVEEKNENPGMFSKKEFLMDTYIEVSLYDKKYIEDTFKIFREIHSLMSEDKKGSDAYNINHSNGQWTEINPMTKEVIEDSIEYSKSLNNSYDISLGKLVELWDIDNLTKVPYEEEIEIAKNQRGIKYVEIEGNKIKLDSDIHLVFGAVGAGYGGDKAKEYLLSKGVESGILDLGGDLTLIGEKPKGEPWAIGVRNPIGDDLDYYGILKVKDTSVASSGNYERYKEIDGKRYHHILDPESGYPAENNLASVTVVTKSGAKADAYATGFFVIGIDKALEIVNSEDDLGAIFVTEDKKVYITPNLLDKFTLTDENFELIVL